MSYPICGVCQYGICSLEIDYSKILKVYVVYIYMYNLLKYWKVNFSSIQIEFLLVV